MARLTHLLALKKLNHVNSVSFWHRGMPRHPADITCISSHRDGAINGLLEDRKNGGAIQPLFDFGVAISKGKAAGTIMIGGGNVAPSSAFGGIGINVVYVETVIDTIRVLVQEDEEIVGLAKVAYFYEALLHRIATCISYVMGTDKGIHG